jgi:hypothetical protein
VELGAVGIASPAGLPHNGAGGLLRYLSSLWPGVAHFVPFEAPEETTAAILIALSALQ